MTLKEADDRITEIDGEIFKADTAQVSMTWEHYCALKIEADSLMKVLCEELAKEMNRPLDVVVKDRTTVRFLDRLELTCKRHREIYPVPIPAHDEIIKSAFSDASKPSKDRAAELDSIFGYMFANAPTDPRPPAPRKGLIRRLLRQ
jgi:hypothetical protein